MRSVIRQQTIFFALALTISAVWFAINILDIWSITFDFVSERFDVIVVLRINAGLATLMVASSGLRWAYHRRKATYPTLVEFFFGVCFAAFLFVLISSGVPAVFGG